MEFVTKYLGNNVNIELIDPKTLFYISNILKLTGSKDELLFSELSI